MGNRKKKNEVLQEMKPTLALAGLSMGSSVLGGSLQPMLPPGVSNPLTETGRVGGMFVRPFAVLGVSSFMFKKLKRLEKKVKKR